MLLSLKFYFNCCCQSVEFCYWIQQTKLKRRILLYSATFFLLSYIFSFFIWFVFVVVVGFSFGWYFIERAVHRQKNCILYDRHYKLCRVQLIYCVQRKQFSKNHFCSSLVFTYIWNLLLSLLKTIFLSKKRFSVPCCVFVIAVHWKKRRENFFNTLQENQFFLFEKTPPFLFFVEHQNTLRLRVSLTQLYFWVGEIIAIWFYWRSLLFWRIL